MMITIGMAYNAAIVDESRLSLLLFDSPSAVLLLSVTSFGSTGLGSRC